MHVLHLVTLILNVLTCSGQTFVVNVVVTLNNTDVTLICNTSSSTYLTRWTYLAGYTGTSFMRYQNGQCIVLPSDTFLSGSRYSYTCNNTVYQVVMHPFIGSWNNHILACNDAVQPDGSESAWMIKIIQDGYQCNCDPTITFDIIEITEGDNVTFICRVSSDVPFINWNRNIGSNTAAMSGQNEQCATQGTTFLDDTSAYIYICNRTVYQVTRLNVQRSEHNDMYMCTPPTQQEGTGSNWIIKINAPVTFVTMTPADYLVNVKENSVVQFTCVTSTARPAASVYWYRHSNGNWQNETQITVNITTVTDYNDLSITTSILRFVPTRQDNGTKIFCRANNSINASPVQTSMIKLLNVLYKAEDPYIPQGPGYRVIENTAVMLSCSVKGGNPKPTLSWRCNNFSPTNQSTIDSDGIVTATFTWTPFRTHEGTCTCTSQQKGFPNTTANVSLIVLYPPSKPVFTVNGNSINGDVSLIEGHYRSIKCTADSKPSPERYTWTGPIITGSVNIQALTFATLKKEDAGQYICSVHNTMNPSNGTSVVGINSSAVNVSVLYPPAVLPINDILTLKGTQLNMVCNFTAGMPESTMIKWTRDIDNKEWNTVTLNIESLEKSDTGMYMCTASNTMKQSGDSISFIGQHNQSFHLDVQYAASITAFVVDGLRSQTVTVNESDPIRLICIADSNPTAEMTLSRESKTLKNVISNSIEYNIVAASCLDASIYYCSARNVYNAEKRVYNRVQLFVNCLPRVVEEIIDVNITSEKNKTATIVFNVIAYPPPTFIWYQLVAGNWFLLHDGDKYITKSTDLQSNISIRSVGMNDFTRYKVAVENDFGQMEQIYTLSPYDKPDSPTSLRYYEDHTTTSSIIIEWEPGFDNGPSQTFFIKYKKSSDTVWNYRTVIDNGEPTMNLTLTGLLENTQYEVIMFASNVKGNSTETNVLLVKTKAIQLPPSIPGSLIGGITGAVTGCIIIVVVIIFIIRKYPLFEVCSERVARGKSDRTSQPAEENAYYNVGSDTNGNDNSAEDSAYDNVTSDTEYETINQNKVESTQYSTLDLTELGTTLDDTSDENVAVYENLKLQVF